MLVYTEAAVFLTGVNSLDSDRTVGADCESKTIFSSNNVHLETIQSGHTVSSVYTHIYIYIHHDKPGVSSVSHSSFYFNRG